MNLMIGLDRSQFDRKKVTFQEHITKEHNPWHYLHFIILLKEKVYTEFTGPESFVALSIEVSSNISINIYLISTKYTFGILSLCMYCHNICACKCCYFIFLFIFRKTTCAGFLSPVACH